MKNWGSSSTILLIWCSWHARALQPPVVVLEDCDLIAEDRSFGDGPQPLFRAVVAAALEDEPVSDSYLATAAEEPLGDAESLSRSLLGSGAAGTV